MKEFYIVEDIIDIVGISYSQLGVWIKEGTFPPPDLGGGAGSRRRWKRSTVDKWKDGLGQGNES